MAFRPASLKSSAKHLAGIFMLCVLCRQRHCCAQQRWRWNEQRAQFLCSKICFSHIRFKFENFNILKLMSEVCCTFCEGAMEGMKYKVSGRGMAGETGVSEVSVLT